MSRAYHNEFKKYGRSYRNHLLTPNEGYSFLKRPSCTKVHVRKDGERWSICTRNTSQPIQNGDPLQQATVMQMCEHCLRIHEAFTMKKVKKS